MPRSRVAGQVISCLIITGVLPARSAVVQICSDPEVCAAIVHCAVRIDSPSRWEPHHMIPCVPCQLPLNSDVQPHGVKVGCVPSIGRETPFASSFAMFGARPQAAMRRHSSMLAPSVPISIAFLAGPGRYCIVD